MNYKFKIGDEVKIKDYLKTRKWYHDKPMIIISYIDLFYNRPAYKIDYSYNKFPCISEKYIEHTKKFLRKQKLKNILVLYYIMIYHYYHMRLMKIIKITFVI